jgi:hypothetical protein
MATVNKDFKIKSGLIVEGANATVNGYDVLTKDTADQNYIIGLIGGSATSEATPDSVVLRDANADFAANEISVSSLVLNGSDLQGLLNSADTAAQGYASDAQSAAETFATNADSALHTTITGEIATAKSEAISTAEGYADSAASSAQSAAENYADSLASNYDPAGAAATAESNANNYTDNAITNLNLSGTYDALGAAATAQANAESYTDTAVANLVDGAPALLDTLNELAAAIADNPNYATDVANLVATKADTTYVDSEISGVNSAAQGYATTAENNAKGYADSLAVNYDAAGAADAAETAANSYTDTAISTEVTNRNNAIDSAISGVNSTINALTTDDVAEGINQYFTSNRAKIAAADLITGATKTNIVITGDENGLTITAENGVADSTTDDLVEGESNLYFTDARAVSALEAVTPNFTEIDVNSVAKTVAASLNAPTAGIQVGYEWAKADYRSAEFLVKVAYGTHTEISKVMLTLDTSDNIAITEYAIVGTNGSASSISAGISGGNVQLQVTTSNNNSTVTVMGTLLA